MKKVCEWLCPKRKKEKTPYDVHEETFEMDQNFGEISYAQKNNSEPVAESQHKLEQSQQLNSQVNNQQKQRVLQNQQKKFSQSKNKIEQQPPAKKQIQNPITPIQNQPNVIQSPPPIVQQPKKSQQVPVQKPKPQYNILPSTFKKKKVNPQDYYFKNQQNQFKAKPVDSIKGQQFNIDNCKNGKYFIFDITANIYIDDCQDCFIFAAPVQSSIFVRNCKNMIIVGAVGQFRTYNCHHCHFSIYCKSQPVIESSSNIYFSTLSCPEYPELRQQFQKVGLYPWNNNWSQIHNFTKKQGQIHYKLHQKPSYQAEIDWQRAFSQSKLQLTNQYQQIVPFIQGALPLQNPPTRKILILNSQISKSDQTIYSWIKKHNIHLLRASKTKINGQKQFTIALMINDENDIDQLNLSQIGQPTVIQDKNQVQANEGKYFVGFKDQRQG